jgi:two-component system sensor histidine kinase DegS
VADTGPQPSPFDPTRELVMERLVALENATAAYEAELAETEAVRFQLRDRADEADVIRRHAINNLWRFTPDDIDGALETVIGLRSDLAVLEERIRYATARLAEMREEREFLTRLLRAVDDLPALDGAAVDVEAARFRSASRQVFQIIEEERMRIARDMHDGPAQSMANLVLQAEVLERLLSRDPKLVVEELADFKAGVRDALEETRDLIFDLRPMTLDDLGLVPTLRKFVKEFGDKSSLAARFHVVGEERRLPGNYEAVLFRIIQEALTNVRKHAHAQTAEVTLTLQASRVIAVVKDDGEGFDVAATEARLGRTRNLGLISMRERADLEKGSLEIRSQVGKGTEVRVTFDY